MSYELAAVPSPAQERTPPREAAGPRWRAEAAVRKALRTRRFGLEARIGMEAAVTLVIDGLERAARSAGVSGRTLRRRFSRDGASVSGFAAEVRLEAARELYAQRWETGEVAAALGYSSAAAFRRFLRQNSGEGVWRLRKAAGGPRGG